MHMPEHKNSAPEAAPPATAWQAQAELLNEMSRMAKVGGWEYDPATGQGGWTDEVARIHDLDPCQRGDLQLSLSCYTGESRTRMEQALREAVELGKPYDLELAFRSTKGLLKWVRTIGRPVVENGRVVKVWGTLQDISERKRVEQALLLSEEKFSKLFDSSPEAILLSELDTGRIVEINESFEKLSGYTRAEVVGRTSLELGLVTPEERGRFAALLRTQGHIRGVEFCQRYKAGQERLVVLSAELLVMDGRQQVLSSFHDITERKRAEEALRVSEAHYRLLAENTEDFVFLNDTQGHRLYISPSYYRVTGWAPEDSETADWSARIHPDDLALIQRTRAANLAGQASTIEVRIGCRDGTWLWVEAHCKPVLAPDGKVEHLLLWARDSTRRRQAEEAALRLATAVEQAAECIVVTDLAGVIQYANPVFERITGYTRAEALGQNPRVLKSGSHDAAFYRQMWETLQRGEVWTGHFINRRKDGTLYEEEGTISPVRNPAGEVTNYVAIKRDVTELVRMQEELLQAQKMQVVGQLAGGVAHDFNNILQTILGYSELLIKNTPASDERHRDLLEIQRSGERAANLTRQLLAFSRKQMLMPRVHDLNVIVTNLTTMVTRLLGEDVQLKLDLATDLQPVKVDAGQMDQVLINLAVNARDALPKGGQLSIRTANVPLSAADLPLHPEGRSGSFVCLSITDNGTGMSRDILAHIFEPFFTTKEQGKGTGLGLSTVYGIVKQHDGWITVYSEPGHGTTFRIYLPALVAETPAHPSDALAPAVAAPGRDERILIIEDDPLVRRMTQQMLNRHGYRAVAASSCAEAQAMYNGLFDLVLSDVILPDGNGLDLVRQLQLQRPGLRCILTSGYADIHERWPEIEQHRWPFLIKPYSQADLLRALATALARA